MAWCCVHSQVKTEAMQDMYPPPDTFANLQGDHKRTAPNTPLDCKTDSSNSYLTTMAVSKVMPTGLKVPMVNWAHIHCYS